MPEPTPIRKRMKRWEVPGNVRFITFSCQRRLPLLTNPAICRLFVSAMADTRQRLGCEIFAWVIMPEHVHILMRPADGATLDRSLLAIKLSVAQRVITRWRELDAPILVRIRQPDGTPRFWQKGGGFDRNVRDAAALCREIRYIHHNPVTRGLVAQPDQWPWSSVRWWMGRRDNEFPCDPPPGSPEHWQDWSGYM